MIIEALLGVVLTLLTSLFNLLPSLPDLPDVFTTYWNEFLTILNGGLSFLMNFLVPEVVVGCLSVVIAIFFFDEIYDIVLWFIKKIPFLGIK